MVETQTTRNHIWTTLRLKELLQKAQQVFDSNSNTKSKPLVAVLNNARDSKMRDSFSLGEGTVRTLINNNQILLSDFLWPMFIVQACSLHLSPRSAASKPMSIIMLMGNLDSFPWNKNKVNLKLKWVEDQTHIRNKNENLTHPNSRWILQEYISFMLCTCAHILAYL